MHALIQTLNDKEKSDMCLALKRGLNTWDTAPKWLLDLCDSLDASLKVAEPIPLRPAMTGDGEFV